MKLYELLGIKKGITAVVGSGGKSTLIYTLARELGLVGRVIVTTTTHILNDDKYVVVTDNTKQAVESAFSKSSIVCVGKLSDNKLTTADIDFDVLCELADYVLVEADGARQLPLKIHADYEPVIPKNCKKTILVVGIDAINKLAKDALHRHTLFCIDKDKLIDTDIVADIINTENLCDTVVINKCDTKQARMDATILSQKINAKCFITSLKKGEWYACTD